MKKAKSVKSSTTPETPTRPKLEVVYEFTNDVPGPLQLLSDKDGHWFLGDKGKPAKQATVAEALEWFSTKNAITHDADGSIASLAAAAAQELKAKTDKPITRSNFQLPPVPGPAATREEIFDWMRARKKAIESRTSTEVEMPLSVGLFTYGILAEAGIIHGCTPAEALELFVEQTDELTEWANAGCPIAKETQLLR